jgi:hypothetical protein
LGGGADQGTEEALREDAEGVDGLFRVGKFVSTFFAWVCWKRVWVR